jgi:hypothetical protein
VNPHLRDILLWLGFSAFGWYCLYQLLYTDLLERASRPPGKKVTHRSSALGAPVEKESHWGFWTLAILVTLFGWMTLDGMRGYVRSPGILKFPLAWCRYYTGWPPDLGGGPAIQGASTFEERQRLYEQGGKAPPPTAP